MSSQGRFPFSAVVGQGEARLALLLAAVDPGIGGVLLRGDKGSAKSTLARGLAGMLPGGAPFVELPLGATEDRVLGTIDATAPPGDGAPPFRPGLLAQAHGGVLYVDEVNLLPDHLVDMLLDVAASGVNRVERDGASHSHPARFVLVGSMNPEEGELRPQLLDRFGLSVEITAPTDPAERAEVVRRRLTHDAGGRVGGSEGDIVLRARLAASMPADLPDTVVDFACRLAVGVGAQGLRADLVLCRAAAAYAGWEGRSVASTADVERVASFALGHRRRRRPYDPPTLSTSELERALDTARQSFADAHRRPEPAPVEGPGPEPASASEGEPLHEAQQADRGSDVAPPATAEAGTETTGGPEADGVDVPSGDLADGTGGAPGDHLAGAHDTPADDTSTDGSPAVAADEGGPVGDDARTEPAATTEPDDPGSGTATGRTTAAAEEAAGGQPDDEAGAPDQAGTPDDEAGEPDQAGTPDDEARPPDDETRPPDDETAGPGGPGTDPAATEQAADDGPAPWPATGPATAAPGTVPESATWHSLSGATFGAPPPRTAAGETPSSATAPPAPPPPSPPPAGPPGPAAPADTASLAGPAATGPATAGAPTPVATIPAGALHLAPAPGSGATADGRAAPGGGTGDVALAAPARPASERDRPAATAPGVGLDDTREAPRSRTVGRTVVVAVDASGSTGAHRRVEAATGTVLGLLSDAYLRRDRVAMVTFRGDAAEVVLPPTASVEMARARLAELATGGVTPLADGLSAGLALARRAASDGWRPLFVVVTDGRATGNQNALDRARSVAGEIAGAGIDAMVVDAEEGAGRQGLASQLAATMGAEYVRLDELCTDQLEAAVRDALR
ncbi:MAG: ATP-binding protein [Acidimicrobiales bacterium]|nr:ATP-binding protein [Acidimicrobiales bacterium]